LVEPLENSESTYLAKRTRSEEKQAEAAKEEKRSSANEKDSFKAIFKYARNESTMFGFGIVFLLLGSVGDFVVPLYIGFVITAMSE